MESLNLLMEGFAGALTPVNLMWVVIGCLLGTAVGVMPGLGSSMAVALLLPMTFALDPTAAFILFSGVYFGGLFGDSTMAILMNTPGQASAIASTFEGHKMAKAGRAPQALATAAIGAFIGGFIASAVVVFFAPVLAELSTYFGPAEFFALALFAFVATSSVVSDSVPKGLAALILGLGISTIGIDSVAGTDRFTLGAPQLFDGVSLVTVTVAILALGEVFFVISRARRTTQNLRTRSAGRPWLKLAEFREALPAWGRGTAIGLPFGIIPVGGSEVPTFLAYDVERRLDRRRKEPMFGKGAIRGLAAPEAAGNSTTGMAMGALLALGLPLLLVLAGGLLQPPQMAMNAVMGAAVGRVEPLVLFNYLIGTLALLVVAAPQIAAGGLARLPWGPGDWWYYTGGLLGSVVVIGGALLTRTIGSLLFTLGLVAGQLAGSLVVDAVWPTRGAEVTWQVMTGAVITLLALVLASSSTLRTSLQTSLRASRSRSS